MIAAAAVGLEDEFLSPFTGKLLTISDQLFLLCLGFLSSSLCASSLVFPFPSYPHLKSVSGDGGWSKVNHDLLTVPDQGCQRRECGFERKKPMMHSEANLRAPPTLPSPPLLFFFLLFLYFFRVTRGSPGSLCGDRLPWK